jgi:hypothetical protein
LADSTKRSVGFIRFERNVTALDKRMTLPKRKLGLFYDNEFVKLTDQIVPHQTGRKAEDMSTGVMKAFANLPQDKEYSNGGQLSGCTTLYVISRKGVYGVHWWENHPSLRQTFGGSQRLRRGHFQKKKTVLDMLANGGQYYPKLDASLIEDNWIRAYILHSREASDAEEGGQPTQHCSREFGPMSANWYQHFKINPAGRMYRTMH